MTRVTLVTHPTVEPHEYRHTHGFDSHALPPFQAIPGVRFRSTSVPQIGPGDLKTATKACDAYSKTSPSRFRVVLLLT